jgi:predicted amidohydrolase YtcJ
MDKAQNVKSYVYIKGKIYTANKNNDFVEGIIIENNKIKLVGSNKDCEEFLTSNQISEEKVKRIFMKPSEVAMPGFIDSHVHPIVGKTRERGLDLSNCSFLKEAVEKITEYVKQKPIDEWIIGSGYGDHLFTEENPINYRVLDNICSDRPVVINRYDCHATWLNSKAIEIIQITNLTPNPEAGVIEKDKNGQINGVLHDSAMNFLKGKTPELTQAEVEEILIEAMDKFKSLGIVGYMDAAVRKNFDVYRNVYMNKDMILPRCSLSMCIIPIFFDPDPKDEDPQEGETLFECGLRKLDIFFSTNRVKNWDSFSGGPNRLRVNSVKIFLDGVFESGTALFTCSCMGGKDHTNSKPLTYSQDDLMKVCKYFYENDIQMHCHSIGDLATTNYLNTLEQILRMCSTGEAQRKLQLQKNYLAHMQKVKEVDFQRMVDLNISTNFSPYWFKPDSYTPIFKDLIGKEDVKECYPIKNMLEKGIKICFGSDWPVSTLNPLDGIEVAVTHREIGIEDGDENDSYNPHQNLSLYNALKAYMSGSAYVLGLEEMSGSLEPEKLADVIILDKDIFNIKPSQIHTAKVVMTMIDGEIVFSS